MKILKHTLQIIILLALWTSFIVFGAFKGFLLKSITSDQSPKSFINVAKQNNEDVFIGNMAMLLIEKGEESIDFYYSLDAPINKKTIFQMASVSKWATAWGIFKLIQDGKVDIDAPVDSYLTRWNLSESEFKNQDVTIRNILSHTAGLVDGLGYAGFASLDSVQSLEESLTKAEDGIWSEAVTRVGIEPNTSYRYSGGGYTLLQLLVEEVSGKSFNDYMIEEVFKPLNMKSTTFIWNDSSSLELVKFYNLDSTEAPHLRYTSLAAASLYTNVEDFSLFLKANFFKNNVLSTEYLDLMNKTFVRANQGSHALGPMVFGKNNSGDYIIGHDGMNLNAINNAARINLETKDGIIIFLSGSLSQASKLADKWIFWKTGIVKYSIIESNMNRLLLFLILGYFIILILYIKKIRRLKIKQT